MSEFVSVSVAAKKLYVSVDTIYNMLKDGRLGGRYSKGINNKRGSWLVSIKSIELFQENTTIRSCYEIQKSSQRTLF